MIFRHTSARVRESVAGAGHSVLRHCLKEMASLREIAVLLPDAMSLDPDRLAQAYSIRL